MRAPSDDAKSSRDSRVNTETESWTIRGETERTWRETSAANDASVGR